MELDGRTWAVHRHVIDATPQSLGLDELDVTDVWDPDALWAVLAAGALGPGLQPRSGWPSPAL